MHPPRTRPTLLVVGAAARDIDARDPRGWRLGGTVSYAALSAARLGLQVRALVGTDREAATARELETLRGAGIELSLVELERGPIFENRQIDGVREQIAHQPSDRLHPSSVPAGWESPDAVLLGPVADELDDEWASFAPGALVALAWQGLLRIMAAGRTVELRPLSVTPIVHRADVLFVSAEDVVGGPGPLDELLRDGQELFVTHGQRGAMHVHQSADTRRMDFVAPRPPRRAIDTTGAGDVFLAAYVAARLHAPRLADTREDWRLSAIAAAAASLNVAATSLEAVPGLRELCAALMPPA